VESVAVTALDLELAQREREGSPVRVGLVGAGAMGQVIALQLSGGVCGMRLAAVASRAPARAEQVLQAAGVRAAVTDDVGRLCGAPEIDVLIEASGDVEYGAQVATQAIAGRKHLVLVNVELDATVGPLLKARADRAGVVITGIDGDEPGVAMNLVRLVQTLGLRPVGAGNVKGFLDRFRTPATQQRFAEQWGVRPWLATAAADGTKLSLEAAVLGNATGFKVGRRGMYGPQGTQVRDAVERLPLDQLLNGGLVDYVLGAAPPAGAFVLAYEEHPLKRRWLSYLKLGEGPVYVLQTPYHLPHLQVALTVARAVLDKDATVAPRGAPVCDVLTVAKQDLDAGTVLDGIGGFGCYGVIDNAEVVRGERLLPIGVARGCRLRRAARRDEPIGYDDVDLPDGRLVDRLRAEQAAEFAMRVPAPAGSSTNSRRQEWTV